MKRSNTHAPAPQFIADPTSNVNDTTTTVMTIEPETQPEPIVAPVVIVAPVADVSAILACLPATVTPKHLDIMFKYNDGGKSIRRNLRKHFAVPVNHVYDAAWTFTNNDPILADIIRYFLARSTPDLTKKLA